MSDENKSRHPPHPRCPFCGKAIYKTMIKGKWVKKSDPWAFCRNRACKEYGNNQSGLPTADGVGSQISKRKSLWSAEKFPKKDEIVKDEGKKVETTLLPPTFKATKKGNESAKVAAIKESILSGKYTTAEVIFKYKTTRRVVFKIIQQLKEEGEI